MEGNRDAAEDCYRRALKHIQADDTEKAMRFLHKAVKLYPLTQAKGICSLKS